MDVAHRTLDDTLDHTGLSAFIPHAVHEVSDGAQGLVRRGVDDFGKTTGSVLRSFEYALAQISCAVVAGN